MKHLGYFGVGMESAPVDNVLEDVQTMNAFPFCLMGPVAPQLQLQAK